MSAEEKAMTCLRFTEDQLKEHAIQLGAIGMAGVDRPLWELRNTLIEYIQRHFAPHASAEPAPAPTDKQKLIAESGKVSSTSDFALGFVLGQANVYVEQVKAGAKLAAQIGCSRGHLADIVAAVEGENCEVLIEDRNYDRVAIWIFRSPLVRTLIEQMSQKPASPRALEVWAMGKLFGYSDSEIGDYLHSNGLLKSVPGRTAYGTEGPSELSSASAAPEGREQLAREYVRDNVIGHRDEPQEDAREAYLEGYSTGKASRDATYQRFSGQMQVVLGLPLKEKGLREALAKIALGLIRQQEMVEVAKEALARTQNGDGVGKERLGE